MTKTEPLRVLHLSDLHAGMTGQSLLWSNVKQLFFSDLSALQKQVGRWDVVLFSGDFAQKGSTDEFAEVIHRLEDIWAHFRELGFDPELVCIPGNHDIDRPDSKLPEVKILKRWFDEPDIWQNFFNGPDDTYRSVVTRSHAAYSKFMDDIENSSINISKNQRGILPGDQIIRIERDGNNYGIVCLNSTWLQLSGDDYYGSLSVDLHQIHELNTDLGRWCIDNLFNIIVTHHPLDWLHESSRESWNGEINPPGRFDLHMFGHMHVPFSESASLSGAPHRHSLQAPSLFGMDKAADGKVDRIHGYSLLSFEADEQGRRIRIWPRRLARHKSGKARFIPDTDLFILEDDRYFSIDLKPSDVSKPKSAANHAENILTAADEEHSQRNVLQPIRYHFSSSAAHQHVRRIEQQQCLELLQRHRAVWLASEWGLGSDEFLASALAQASSQRATFLIDASGYSDGDRFSEEIATKLRCSFAQFCDVLSTKSAILVLDDFPADAEAAPGSVSRARDIEEFVQLLLDACTDLWIVVRSLRKQSSGALPSVSLLPLDEADVKVYVAEHERGGDKFTGRDAIDILYRHTDGYPSRLDARLKELTVVSIDELSSEVDDVARGGIAPRDVPLALKRAVLALAESGDKQTRRMFELLKVLMIFPQGTELARIKRFNGAHAFHTDHALGLMDRGLIASSETPEVGNAVGSSTRKILVVPRPIRDYLHTLVDDRTLESLNLRAAALLFGDEWMVGSKSWPPHLDYSSSKCASQDIANASALITRLFRLYRDQPASRESIAIVSLAPTFASALRDGAHYTSASNFCRDFLGLMRPEDSAEKKAHLQRHQGAALRMLGENGRAQEILGEVAKFAFSKNILQSVLIDLALSHKGHPQAIEYANQILSINRRNSYGIHAQSIIVQELDSGAERTRKLSDLEKLARGKKFDTVADNISLVLAEEAEEDTDAENILIRVLSKPSASKDFYNKGRAILEIVGRKMKSGSDFTDSEISQLIACYQFVLIERVNWMFSQCHRALWHVFSGRKDWENLIMLFRYSSMIWRLRGEDSREKDYLNRIKKELRDIPENVLRQNKISSYYFSRLAHYGMAKALPTGSAGARKLASQ